MKRFMPPLNALRAFEATARLLSFQQAAKELNVTHSAVSHQVKKLESDIECSLFLRQGRHIKLTEKGAQYYVEIHEVFRRIEHSTAEIFGDPNVGDLKIQAYFGIIAHWLIKRLGDFRQHYPKININLYNNYLSWEYEKDKADIGIIYSEKTNDELIYHPLFRGALVAICSPEFKQANPNISTHNIKSLPIIDVSEAPNNLRNWFKGIGLTLEDVCIKEVQDNYLLAMESVAMGKGIAIVPIFFASSEIANGSLVVPIEYTFPEIGSWYLVQQPDYLLNSRATCFSHWLKRQLEEDIVLKQYRCE